MKCEKCGQEGGSVRPSCTQLNCPNWNMVDVVLIPVPLPKAGDVSDASDFFEGISDLF